MTDFGLSASATLERDTDGPYYYKYEVNELRSKIYIGIGINKDTKLVESISVINQEKE